MHLDSLLDDEPTGSQNGLWPERKGRTQRGTTRVPSVLRSSALPCPEYACPCLSPRSIGEVVGTCNCESIGALHTPQRLHLPSSSNALLGHLQLDRLASDGINCLWRRASY